MPNDDHMRQSIQEWTKKKLWKTAFKKFEVPFNFLKAVFNKFFLSILEYFYTYIVTVTNHSFKLLLLSMSLVNHVARIQGHIRLTPATQLGTIEK